MPHLYSSTIYDAWQMGDLEYDFSMSFNVKSDGAVELNM